MHPETAIRLARIFHRIVPFAQLRSADWVGRMLNGAELIAETELYGYRALLDLRRSESREIFIRGERWVEDEPDIVSRVRRGMTVFDVGANVGFVTLLLSRLVGELGRVYAFEPDQDNFAALQRNLDHNRISHCVPVNMAAGDRSELVGFAPGINGFVDATAAQTVPMTTLDQFVEENGINRVDFVKIDVEGFELCVLKGMTRVVRRFKPVLLVEIHPRGFCGAGDPEAVVSCLQQLYGSVKLSIPLSSLPRRQRLLDLMSRARSRPVRLEDLHPEQRYFAFCE